MPAGEQDGRVVVPSVPYAAPTRQLVSRVDGVPAGSWASSIGTRRSMQGYRSRDTCPEWKVRQLVHRAGLRYRVSARPLPGVRRTADLVFPRRRVAVFIDGCFWHACPDHFVPPKSHVPYWQGKIERNRARDIETNALLAAAGTVLRFWSHEPAETVAEQIYQAVCRSQSRTV